MKRQKIGHLKWNDVFVWYWLIGVCAVGLGLWVLLNYCRGVPLDFMPPFGGVLVLIGGSALLLQMKTVLEYDGEFLYVMSMRFFVRYVSRQIRVKDIAEIEISHEISMGSAALKKEDIYTVFIAYKVKEIEMCLFGINRHDDEVLTFLRHVQEGIENKK